MKVWAALIGIVLIPIFAIGFLVGLCLFGAGAGIGAADKFTDFLAATAKRKGSK